MSHALTSQAQVSNAYIIEVRSRPAGIIVRQGHRFYFHAAAEQFTALEGRPFKSAQHAQRAALHHAREQSGRDAA